MTSTSPNSSRERRYVHPHVTPYRPTPAERGKAAAEQATTAPASADTSAPKEAAA